MWCRPKTRLDFIAAFHLILISGINWRDVRAAEGARLEIVCALNPYRGFKSHSLRHTFPLLLTEETFTKRLLKRFDAEKLLHVLQFFQKMLLNVKVTDRYVKPLRYLYHRLKSIIRRCSLFLCCIPLK